MRRFIDLYGAEEEEGSNDEAEVEEETEEETPEPRTVTASELETIAARAAGRGSRKATKDLAKELGFESVAAMKDFVAEQKKARDEARSEDEKVREAAAQAAKEAAEERNRLRTERLQLAIQRGIVATGITDERKLNRITALVREDLDPELDEEEWSEGVSEAIGAIRKDMPELFTPPKTIPGSGDGGARGSSTRDETKTKEEQWEAEFRRKGMVPFPQ